MGAKQDPLRVEQKQIGIGLHSPIDHRGISASDSPNDIFDSRLTDKMSGVPCPDIKVVETVK